MKPSFSFSKSVRFLTSALAVGATSFITFSAHSSTSTLSQQRALYDEAQDLLDERKVREYQAMRGKIAQYPLTPYVDYRAFLVDINKAKPSEVNAFIDQRKTFPFSHRVRAPYLDELAKSKQWSRLLEFQTTEPNGERYRCHYYTAHWLKGDKELAKQGAKSLWLSGESVDDACDTLFSQLDKAGYKTDELVIERMLLAYEKRNSRMINYLAKQLDSKEAKQTGSHIKAVYSKPEDVAKFAKKQYVTPENQTLAQLGLKKLARKDIKQAQASYDAVIKGMHLDKTAAQALADYLAFRMINTDDEQLVAWRDKKIATSNSVTLLERRSRLAIQHADWQGLKSWISLLPESKQESLRWTYWNARAQIGVGQESEGKQQLQSIIGKRNFYSVAAAMEMKQSIDYPTTTVTLDKSVVSPYQDALARIDELIARDKITAAKSEWRWLLGRVDKAKKEMLAAYASEQNWHHLAVTASISAKVWDNTQLRFPIAHKNLFSLYGEKHDIDPITLMSLARQESGLDAEARSPVGARGIMQIMPKTAKYTANKFQIEYDGAHELYEVGKNIEIGSHYLNSLLEQYDENRIFALAAYNAGPHRVKQWRERTDGKLDAYAFIEAIPFKETRGYVQNVLMFETYYRDLLGQRGAFLSPSELITNY